MSPSEEQQIVSIWNQVHSVSEVSDMLGIPQAEVKNVLNQAKGSHLTLE